jgi:hypothetical protein
MLDSPIKPNWSALAAAIRAMAITGSSTFAGAVVLPLATDGTLPFTMAAWKPVLAVAVAAGVAAELIWIRSHLKALAASIGLGGTTVSTTTSMTAHTDPVLAAPAAPRSIRPGGFALVPLLAVIAIVGLAVFLAGCIPGTAIVPVTASNSAQVSSCQSSASVHNAFVIGDFAVGGIGATLGSVAAAESSDPNTAKALAVAAAVTAGVGVFGAAVASLAASNFANGQCTTVVGALPTSPLGKTVTTTTPAPAPTGGQ